MGTKRYHKSCNQGKIRVRNITGTEVSGLTAPANTADNIGGIMVLTPDQLKEFEAVTRPVIEFLSNNCHSHVLMTIDCTGAEIFEASCCFRTEEYLEDL